MYLLVQANSARQNLLRLLVHFLYVLTSQKLLQDLKLPLGIKTSAFSSLVTKKIEDDMRIVLLPEWKLPIQM